MKIYRVRKGQATIMGTAESTATPTVHRSINDVKLDKHGKVPRAPAKAYFEAVRRSREENRQLGSQRQESLKGN